MKTLLLIAIPFAAGCAQLLDGDHDYHLSTGGAGTGGADGGSGTTTTDSGGGGATTAPGCEGNQNRCNDVCSDLSSDPENCGYCGHDCQGGACNDGLCDVTELLTGLDHPDSLEVDQTHLFFTTQDGTIQRIPKQGGAPDVLASGVGVPWSLALQAGHVYWSERKSHVLQRIAKNGLGGVKTLCAPQVNIDEIAVDQNGIYFVMPFDMFGNGPGSIGHLPLAGGEPTWIAQDLFRPHYLAIGADRLYFGQGVIDGPKYVDGYISEVPLEGGPVMNIALGELVPQGVAVDKDAVYWVDDEAQDVRKKDLTTGQVTTLASGQDVPYHIGIDDDFLYWATLNAGTVARVSKKGGPVQTLASGRERPFGLAVDGKRVYWTESMAIGRVMSVPK